MNYYILCLERRNEWWALWWAPRRQGYTGDLDKAGIYTKEEARDIATLRNGNPSVDDIPVPVEMAQRFVVKHVDLDALRQAMKDSDNPTSKEVPP